MKKTDNLQIENKVLQIKLFVSMNICKREHIQVTNTIYESISVNIYQRSKSFAAIKDLDMLKDGECSLFHKSFPLKKR